MEFDPSKYSSTAYDASEPAKELINILIKNFNIDHSSPMTILDLGCGPGNFTYMLAKHFPQATIYGLDIDAKMVQYAQENCPNDRCYFRTQDLNRPFDQWNETTKQELLRHPVDAVFSNYALQWISDPRIISDTLRRILNPKTGVLVASILYSDILSVIETEQERMLISKYLDYPDERRFIGDWLFALKDNGNFHNIWFQYRQPRSIYPEKYYKESYVNIPLKWHEKFILPNAPEEIKLKISKMLKNLILRKRIKRIIPRELNGDNNGNNQNNINCEINDIEIEQQLWIMVVRPN